MLVKILAPAKNAIKMAEATKTIMADCFLILVQMVIEINILNSQNILEHIETLMYQLEFLHIFFIHNIMEKEYVLICFN